MELHVSLEHRARAEALLTSLGLRGNVPLIGINPGASMKAKRWPVERFAAVGAELADRYDAQILVLGGPDDEGRAAAIARSIPGALSVAGRARLGETAALLRRCRLLISGDTGPLHMAVALGIPSVGLFGPTNPGKYGPWSSSGAGGPGPGTARWCFATPTRARSAAGRAFTRSLPRNAWLLRPVSLSGELTTPLRSSGEERRAAMSTAV